MIVEDETLLLQGLVAVVQGGGMTVVATATDAVTGEAAVRSHRPDLLLTDIRLPPGRGTDGLDAVLRLRRDRPALPVMVLSQYVTRGYAHDLLAGRAPAGTGYQLKQRVGDPATFVTALRTVAAGGIALDPEVVQLMAERARAGDDGLHRLTPRQREVLALLATGRSNSGIAQRLGVGERAVVAHTSRIYDELGIAADDADHRRVLAVLRYLGETGADGPAHDSPGRTSPLS
ncbi:response regulator transcription factor [Aquipuribacter sp. SD81]|uniref:response regulator transcription factor n=1 Tax=Aquipuribacter sp. SD81 TaxID=3127703 RepID=UPI00301AF388